MANLIERQAAIDALRAMQTYKMFAGDDLLLIDQAGAQTELMMLPPAQPEQRWIPVTERLPEKRGFYLVTEKEYRIGDKNHLGKFKTKVNFVEFENKWNRANFFEITAWMELPEPYKGEQE